ncbi:dienelactone hydrolase [Paenibacillus sp. JGP012]|uniref:alpha/beta hydrolase n=1 Tax=Paenibacillus sp. JGP012 TaxID=2735914 RepID=UPI001619F893|nr:alpha/beta fold hydrolase [Paenibacillus sp. JGP012]MBB6021447.1 dienelactone hydrolase [Paenibacillus sp. JGP012]
MSYEYIRKNIVFQSEGTNCAAWLYVPDTPTPPPVIVMAHGLGGVREMRLDAYAEHFVREGYACFLFDYRHFGASEGNHRQKINVKLQLQDWESAIDWVKKSEWVDGKRIILLGSSFSGGHVMTMSARHPEVSAAIAQCPFTDGKASRNTVPITSLLKLSGLVVLDLLSCLTGYHPVKVKLAGKPGEAALMAVPDYQEYLALVPEKASFHPKVPARTILEFFKYSPGKYTAEIQCSIYFGVCDLDTVAPAKETLKHAALAPKGTIKRYPCGHFDIYRGKHFEVAIQDYIAFLKQEVPVH